MNEGNTTFKAAPLRFHQNAQQRGID
jgi:hypothetical protein